ncbi:MAG: hypothetical protein PUD20_10230 [bacterium]|nr:hypothetical protein [bacterium]
MDDTAVLEEQIPVDNIQQDEEEHAKQAEQKEGDAQGSKPLLMQTITLQTPPPGGKSFGVFSRAAFEEISGKSISKLPEAYQQMGAYLDAYSAVMYSGQGATEQGKVALKANLQQIYSISERYLLTEKAGKRNRMVRVAMGVLKKQSKEKMDRLENRGENPSSPQQQVRMRLSGPLPMPGRPVEGAANRNTTPPAAPAVNMKSAIAQGISQVSQPKSAAKAEVMTPAARPKKTIAQDVSQMPVLPVAKRAEAAPPAMQRKNTIAHATMRVTPPKGETANDFLKWKLVLLNAEKGGLGWNNSKYFLRVQDALENTMRVLSKQFGSVSRDNIDTLLEATTTFQTLLDSCRQYTARKPRTQSGIERRNLVLQIQEYAQLDLHGCKDAIHKFQSMPEKDQAKETWQSVLGNARASLQTEQDGVSRQEKSTGSVTSRGNSMTNIRKAATSRMTKLLGMGKLAGQALVNRLDALDVLMVRYVLKDLFNRQQINKALRYLDIFKKSIQKTGTEQASHSAEKEASENPKPAGEQAMEASALESSDGGAGAEVK